MDIAREISFWVVLMCGLASLIAVTFYVCVRLTMGAIKSAAQQLTGVKPPICPVCKKEIKSAPLRSAVGETGTVLVFGCCNQEVEVPLTEQLAQALRQAS